jgi:predicted CopG family antitoxin
MKNVTITVEDDVLEWARVKAARDNTSVSRLLGEWMKEKRQQEDAYEVAMRAALKFKSWGASDGPYLTREEMYDRARFR